MAARRVTGGLAFALALTVIASVVAVPYPVAAAEPSGYAYFHTYAEMGALIDRAVADHPNIAAKFSIGQSYEGRAIRAIRLTANVNAGNHGRPEILIHGLTHGRERASSEFAIHMIKVLTNNYGRDTRLGRRVTRILQSTVVYIIPMINPDGGEFDFKNGRFHKWRKNRQPIPGSSEIGVDLNRQAGYTWGCCGGSSGNPSSDFYRGPEPWFAPEINAYRDFVNGRVVNGEQRLKGILSIHSAGRMVLWPYAYTKEDVPADMVADDHRAMVALGRGMAQRNGYSAKQGSDLYIVDGDMDDWAYGRHRIFAFTIEMARGSAKRYYPSRKELKADLKRNRKATLWFLEQADCPYRAAGLEGEYCGSDGTGSTVQPTSTRFNQSVYNSSVVQPQKTNCWCVVAGTRAWLRHLDPSWAAKQSALSNFMTQHDKNDWTDPSTSYHIRCTAGSPSPSFAHDGRGMAWTLWNYAPTGLGYGFQDYQTTGAKAMNWQMVRNIRATEAPVGAIVAGGRHAILVVGYRTKIDPMADHGQDNRLYGFRLWDPWYQAGFGNWSGWPSGGFAGNAYVTVADWNQKYFKPDRHEGPYYYGSYVAILPTADAVAPSDNPGRSYGQVTWEAAGGTASSFDSGTEATQASAATLSVAIEDGLHENDLLGDPELGNLPASYAIGDSLRVESLAAEVPSYHLVELRARGSVRAVALVNETDSGFRFGELREVSGNWQLPSQADLRARLAANGLRGQPRLVWAWTDEPSPPFAPFLAGLDAEDRLHVVTAGGLKDGTEFARGSSLRLQ